MFTTTQQREVTLMGEQKRPPNSPRSLVISPNLEALLEYEESIRSEGVGRLKSVALSSETEGKEHCLQPTTIGTYISLPPPPRNTRGQRRYVDTISTGSRPPQITSPSSIPKEDKALGTCAAPISTSESNPYINPAPTLHDLLDAEDEAIELAILQALPPTAVEALKQFFEGDGTRGLSATRDFDKFSGKTLPRFRSDGRNKRRESGDDNLDEVNYELPSDISVSTAHGPQHRYSHLRVKSLLSIRKKSSNILADSRPQKSEIAAIRKRLSLKQTSFASSLNRTRKATPKLVPLNLNTIPPIELTNNLHDSPVIDIRRTSSPVDTMPSQGFASEPHLPLELTWRHRPLISHVPSSSRSSLDSSNSSDTTHEPPSTNEHEPRISISSTIYHSSSSHSHPHSFFNNEDIAFTDSSMVSHQRQDMQLHENNLDRQSFIEIFSPSDPQFSFDGSKNTSPPLMYATKSNLSSSLDEATEEHYRPPKPPIPTTPKPVFNRMMKMPNRKSSPKTSSVMYSHPSEHDKSRSMSCEDPLPPTTNFLNTDDRYDLVRKSRKLAQMFGQTPGERDMLQQDTGRGHLIANNATALRHQCDQPIIPSGQEKSDILHDVLPTIPTHIGFVRRHSVPLSSDDASFLSVTPKNDQFPITQNRQVDTAIQDMPLSDVSAHHATAQIRTGSRISFIDLSDDETSFDDVLFDGYSKRHGCVRRPPSPSSQSLFENMSPEEQAEEEKRRKREKLAKLHRFLGSRVPADLVLGLGNSEAALPPVQLVGGSMNSSNESEASRKAWLRRRRSSSVVALPSTWSDDIDRMKEELNDKEKAINVRRAQKMEKVFGVAPPQTLYHTRHSPSPSFPTPSLMIGTKSLMKASGNLTSVEVLPNPNKGHVKAKKKHNRPGTAESSKQLLPNRRDSVEYDELSVQDSPILGPKKSLLYNHYQHSLSSLNDIIDRDDRESLAELHLYLNNSDMASPLQDIPKVTERRISNASLKSERRRSLPARTSMISISSEISITTPKPEVTDFQMRRRRAAKLTHFFGVDYRELINDVLESIEHGLEHERKRGTLRAEEVEDLLERLRNLRIKRQGIY